MLNNYLVWPRMNILVFDMASKSLKASFSRIFVPELWRVGREKRSMQVLKHARAPTTSRLNNYLAWPRVDILVFDMAPLSPKASLSKIVCP
jgi:hypothetical protein